MRVALPVFSSRRTWLASALAVVLVSTGPFNRLANTQAPPAAPILVVVNTVPGCDTFSTTCNPFGNYLGEILRAEGINSFSTIELANLQSSSLTGVRLVILAETPLTTSQIGLLTTYVEGGGRLVAMKPVAGLGSLLGFSSVSGTTTDGYVRINTSSSVGAGFSAETLPFKGDAFHLTPTGGAEVLADLYSSTPATTFNGWTTGVAQGVPAVLRFGRTATWSFDLARSVVYARQGRPEFANQDRDGIAPIRTNDVFYGDIDLDRMHVPHADVQQRLFARVVQDLLADALPIPRIWYFPNTSRTVVVVTGDDHNSQNALEFASVFEQRGVRASIYVVHYNALPDAQQLTTLRQAGHEIGMHPWNTATPTDLAAAFQQVLPWFVQRNAAPSRTTRNHQVLWDGWVNAAKVQANFGIGLDTSFYNWGPAITYNDNRQAKGYINGSGLSMRFVDESGVIVPVYQLVTSLVDEQLFLDTYIQTCCSEDLTAAQAIAVSRQNIDESEAGNYSAVMTQFHVDVFTPLVPQYATELAWATGTVDYALSLGVPVWTAERWLKFVEARAATSMTNLVWQQPGDELSFSVAVPAGSEALSLHVPASYGGLPLRRVSLDGAPVSTSLQTITGRQVATFNVPPAAGGASRTVRVKYGDALVPGNTPPVANPDSASTGLGAPVTIPVVSNDTDVNGDILLVTGAGIALHGTVSIGSDSTSLTYTPNPSECGSDSFTYTIDDGRGGTSTGTVSVTVACTNAITHTTVADFAASCSAPVGTRVTQASNGEVSLTGAFGDEFVGTTLGSQWASGGSAPSVASGVLTVSGPPFTFTWVRSAAVRTVTTLEARAQFSAGAYEHLGWASPDFIGDQYLIVSTYNGDGNLYARSNMGTGELRTSLGAIPSGYHDYRIERQSQSGGTDLIRYFRDGTLVAEHTVSTAPSLHVYVSTSSGSPVAVDRLWVAPPYVASGSYDSCSLDAGGTVTWISASWVSQLSGGSIGVRTRTSVNGSTWSSWSAPLTGSGQVVTSPPGRYLQYRLEMASPTSSATPVLSAITFFYGNGTIVPPTVAIADVSVSEGDVGQPAAAIVSVTLSVANAAPVTVDWITADGPAIAPMDYTASAGTVSFAPGATTASLTIPIVGDATIEADETFVVNLSNPTGGAAIADTQATVTIVNDDVNGYFLSSTVADFSAACTVRSGTRVTNTGDGAIGLAGSGGDDFNGTTLGSQWASGGTAPVVGGGLLTVSGPPFSFDWVRSASVQAVTNLEARVQFSPGSYEHVGWASADYAGDQYLIVSTYNGDGNLYARSNMGGVEQRTSLGALPSGLHDYRIERFPQVDGTDVIRYFMDGVQAAQHTVTTVPQLHAYMSTSSGAAIVVDRIGAYPPFVASGSFDGCPFDAGTPVSWTSMSWVAQLSGGSASVRTRTSNDATAWSAWSALLTGSGQPITSPPGRYLQYRLELTTPDAQVSPILESIAAHIGTGGPPPTPSISVGDVSLVEGDSGTTNAVLVVSLSIAAPQPVSVDYATTNGTATSGTDYTATSGTLTIPAGQSSGTILVPVIGDGQIEGDETFTVTLSAAVGATISDDQATGTIANDDVQPPASSATHTSVVDFLSCGPLVAGTMTTRVGDGEVQLAGSFGDTYSATTLDPRWESGTWSGGAYTPLLAGGTLSLGGPSGAFVRSATTMPVTTLDADVRFSAAPWEHLGWASLDFATSQYLLFSTFSGTTNLFARSSNGGGEQRTDLGPIPTGFHNFRIVRAPLDAATDVVTYFVDGIERAQHTLPTLPDLYVYQSHNGGISPTLDVDSIWVYPSFVASGVFESCTVDAFGSVAWTTADWSATVPADTALAVATRSSSDGATWSAWSSPLAASGSAISSPPGRYLQYQLTFSSAASTSPTVDAVTIRWANDGPSMPTVSVNDASATEGNSGTVNATFNVVLSAASSQVVTVTYGTANDTATSGVDYTSMAGTLTIPAGQTAGQIIVPVTGDTTVELDEAFTVTLTSPVGAALADAQAVGTIVNDDIPSLAISNVTVTEGNSGSLNAGFTVTLSAPASQAVSVSFATANGTATAGVDYVARSDIVVFPVGSTSQNVTIAVSGDTRDEADETFFINLSNPVGAPIADNQGVGTILDNDPQPFLNINNVTVNEGSSTATFTVSLTAASGLPVSVSYATAAGTAAEGTDYVGASGTLTIAAGSSSATLAIALIGDTVDELNETFVVNLSNPVNAALSAGQGQGTINDNDATPSLRINNVSVSEGTGSTVATFTVTLTGTSDRTITVQYATANNTATAALDYTAASGTLTFPPGTPSQPVAVAVLGDVLDEASETYFIDLSGAVNAGIADTRGVGTITDNDPTPSLVISDVSVAEGNTGTIGAVFTVTLSAVSGRTVTVAYATANNTAVAPSDYTSTSGTLTFAPGSTSLQVTVLVNGDTLVEPNESFYVNLSGATNASIADSRGVATIVNND